MAHHGNILLVSSNPEAHRLLELIASTYNFGIVGAENAKSGINLMRACEPDCVIFDFELLVNQRQKVTAKKKLDESGVPILILNNNGNGTHPKIDGRTPLRVEPMVRFVADTRERLNRRSHGGFLNRLPLLGRLRRAW